MLRVEEPARKENLSLDERRDYERHLKVYNDFYSKMLFAERNARSQGLAEGRAEGSKSKELELISSMRAYGLTEEQITAILKSSAKS